MAYGGSRHRWQYTADGSLTAFPAAEEWHVIADPITGTVHVGFKYQENGTEKVAVFPLKAHAAHAIGVRLIEATVLADGNRSIKTGERKAQ